MRRFFHRFICVLFIAFLSGKVTAQVCDGSLGDPVVSESFNQGGELPNGQAQIIQFTTNTCPQDGQYTIVRTYAPPPCNAGTWHSVPSDNTGNGGYMMVVNASYAKSQFFEKKVTGLCGNTVYELSVYILDLMRLDIESSDVRHPALRFLIVDDKDSTIRDTTIAIKPTAGAEFIKRGVTFRTTPNTDSVTLKIFNDAEGGYGNDFILDDFAFRACGPQLSSTIDGAAQDFSACASSGSRNFTLRAASQPGYVFQWQEFINNEWKDIAGQNSTHYIANIDLSVAAVHQYRIAAARAGNLGSENCRIYSLPQNITIYALPVLAPINNFTICRGEDVTINLSGGVRYRLLGPDGFRAETTNSQYTFKSPDPPSGWSYTAYAVSAEGCLSDPQTFQINVKPQFVANAETDKANICRGESAQLNVTTDIADNYTYNWSPATGLSQANIANPVVSPTQTTTYTVVVSNGACSYTDTVTVSIIESPEVTLTTRRDMLEGATIKLDPVYAGAITTYKWWPEDGLNNPADPNPSVAATEDVRYTVTVTGPCGIDTASVFVRVYQKIQVPNTFTPNGDGINDVWNIAALSTYPASETLIFNRNGQQVFRSVGYTTPWDGTFNSTRLPAGTYYYIIDLKNNTPKVAGYVTLLR